jgi:formylmethanofuran dehydrogenase subunit D
MAVQAAFIILNAADFELVVEEDGSMAVFSSDGDIVLDSKEYIRYDEY